MVHAHVSFSGIHVDLSERRKFLKKGHSEVLLEKDHRKVYLPYNLDHKIKEAKNRIYLPLLKLKEEKVINLETEDPPMLTVYLIKL